MDVDVLCCQEAANEEMSFTSELEEVWNRRCVSISFWIILNPILVGQHDERYQAVCLNFELVMNLAISSLVQLSSHLCSPGGLHSPGAAQRWRRNRKTRDLCKAKQVSGTANYDNFGLTSLEGDLIDGGQFSSYRWVSSHIPSYKPPSSARCSGIFQLCRWHRRIAWIFCVRKACRCRWASEPWKNTSLMGQDGDRHGETERELGQFV